MHKLWLKKRRRVEPQPKNTDCTSLSETSRRPASDSSGTSPERHDGQRQNPSREAVTAGSSTGAESRKDVSTPSKAANLWIKAEQMLMDDSNKREIWQAHLKILASELGSDLKPSGTEDRQNQLCQLLDAKTRELK